MGTIDVLQRRYTKRDPAKIFAWDPKRDPKRDPTYDLERGPARGLQREPHRYPRRDPVNDTNGMQKEILRWIQ